MSDSESEQSRKSLEKRIKKLEKRVYPGRRGVLAGGAAAGASLLGFSAGRASADGLNDGDTQWGSDSNRDDYVIDHADANSIDTDGLSGTIRFIDPSGTVSDWQTTIDNLSADGGGTVVAMPGTYDVDAAIDIKDDVVLDGLSLGAVQFRLVDSYGSSPPPVIRMHDGVVRAGVRNVEIDGNQANNTSSFNDGNEGHGIVIEDVDNNNRPERCFAENCFIHDTIRTNLVMSGKHCTARNLWVSNSATDHWIYFSRPENCTVENVIGWGFSSNGPIVFGGNAYDCVSSTIRNFYAAALSDAPDGGACSPLITWREAGSGATHRDNLAKNITVDTTGYTDGASIIMRHSDPELKNFNYYGPCNRKHIISVDQRSDRAHVDNATIKLTDTAQDLGYAARLMGTNQYLDIDFRETSTNSYRGVLLDGTQETVTNATISGYLGGGESVGIRAADNGNGIRQLNIKDLIIDHSTEIEESGTVTYSSGVMRPQDVTAITSLHTGYLAYNDGTVGTEGTAEYRSDGSWYHIASNTAI